MNLKIRCSILVGTEVSWQPYVCVLHPPQGLPPQVMRMGRPPCLRTSAHLGTCPSVLWEGGAHWYATSPPGSVCDSGRDLGLGGCLGLWHLQCANVYWTEVWVSHCWPVVPAPQICAHWSYVYDNAQGYPLWAA